MQAEKGGKRMAYRVELLKVLLPVLLAVSISSASAQNACTAGPICTAAGSRAQTYMSNQQSRLKGPYAAQAAVLAYCTSQVMAEVSRACGDELAAAGQRQCSALAYQQRDEFVKAADRSKQSAEGFSAGDWKEPCGW